MQPAKTRQNGETIPAVWVGEITNINVIRSFLSGRFSFLADGWGVRNILTKQPFAKGKSSVRFCPVRQEVVRSMQQEVACHAYAHAR